MLFLLWNLKVQALFSLALLTLPSSYFNAHENDVNNKSLAHKRMFGNGGTIVDVFALWLPDSAIMIMIIIAP